MSGSIKFWGLIKSCLILVGLSTLSLSVNSAVMTTGCAGATSCTLSELYSGGTISINDIVFDSFFLDFSDPDGLVDASAVTVSGKDEVVDAGDATKSTLGLSFIFDPAVTREEDEELEYIFGYDVTSAVATMIAAELTLVDHMRVDDAFVEINSEFDTTELLTVTDNIFDIELSASEALGGLLTQSIITDIQMGGFPPINNPSLASLTQFDLDLTVMRQSSSVPEPSTVLLFCLGFLGLAMSRRRVVPR